MPLGGAIAMIPETQFELLVDVKAICESTMLYGIMPDQSGKIRFSDLAETVVAIEKWCWISRTELREVITLDRGYFSLVDDLIIRVTGEMFPTLSKYPIVQLSPKILFHGAANSTIQQSLAMGQSQGF